MEERKPQVWVVRAGKGGRNAADFEQAGLIAIGFNEVGDPRGLERDTLFARAREVAGSRGTTSRAKLIDSPGLWKLMTS